MYRCFNICIDKESQNSSPQHFRGNVKAILAKAADWWKKREQNRSWMQVKLGNKISTQSKPILVAEENEGKTSSLINFQISH